MAQNPVATPANPVKIPEKTFCVDSIATLKNISQDVTTLIFKDYNEMIGDVIITGLKLLKSIVIAKNSLAALSSLKICDCSELKEIRAENSDIPENINTAVTSLEISSRNSLFLIMMIFQN